MTEVAELIYRKEDYNFIRSVFLWNSWELFLSKAKIYVVEIYIGTLKVSFTSTSYYLKIPLTFKHSELALFLFLEWFWLNYFYKLEWPVCKLRIFYCSEFSFFFLKPQFDCCGFSKIPLGIFYNAYSFQWSKLLFSLLC